jgi:hydroxymethylbilane synthase
MNNTVLIGTRGSKLALIQAERVRASLESKYAGLETEIRVIKTKGDKILDSPLSQIEGKGLFIREIEEALIEGRIDVAVHSLKDLPTTLPPELVLGGVLPREDPRDALISGRNCRFADLKAGERIGTSSLRRRAQLLKANPELEVIDIRGNVDTRLEKLEKGLCDALVLAACGLARAGYVQSISETLDPELMLPAVCQGIIGMEVRKQDERINELLAGIRDPSTLRIAEAERNFLHRVEGGCQVPIGCLATDGEGRGVITGLVASLDGTRVVRCAREGRAGDLPRLADELAEEVLENGGAEILGSIRKHFEG